MFVLFYTRKERDVGRGSGCVSIRECFFEWDLIEKHVMSYDSILVDMTVLVSQAKSIKSLKREGVRPLL